MALTEYVNWSNFFNLYYSQSLIELREMLKGLWLFNKVHFPNDSLMPWKTPHYVAEEGAHDLFELKRA